MSESPSELARGALQNLVVGALVGVGIHVGQTEPTLDPVLFGATAGVLLMVFTVAFRALAELDRLAAEADAEGDR